MELQLEHAETDDYCFVKSERVSMDNSFVFHVEYGYNTTNRGITKDGDPDEENVPTKKLKLTDKQFCLWLLDALTSGWYLIDI